MPIAITPDLIANQTYGELSKSEQGSLNEFSVVDYYNNNPDVKASDLGALQHYLAYGIYEGRPAPTLSRQQDQYGSNEIGNTIQVSNIRQNASWQHQSYSNISGSNDGPAAQSAVTPADAKSATEKFLRLPVDQRQSLVQNFNGDAYLAANPDVAGNAEFKNAPLTHYLLYGINDGRQLTTGGTVEQNVANNSKELETDQAVFIQSQNPQYVRPQLARQEPIFSQPLTLPSKNIG